MSVLHCNRKGCESIMCDLYSHEHGYICYNCATEYDNLKEDITVHEFMRRDKSDDNMVNLRLKEDIWEVFNYEQ